MSVFSLFRTNHLHISFSRPLLLVPSGANPTLTWNASFVAVHVTESFSAVNQLKHRCAHYKLMKAPSTAILIAPNRNAKTVSYKLTVYLCLFIVG